MTSSVYSVEGWRNDEHYQNILRETAVVSEQENDRPTAFLPRRARGEQIYYKQTYFQIIDYILMSLRERFADMQKYAFSELLDVDKFEEFSGLFPMQHVDALRSKYSIIMTRA